MRERERERERERLQKVWREGVKTQNSKVVLKNRDRTATDGIQKWDWEHVISAPSLISYSNFQFNNDKF